MVFWSYIVFLGIFVLQGEGGRAYANKANKARVGGFGQMLTLADKEGRGVSTNADIG